ncbi:YidC/Oxa1 family insertase periplasmic-domain containing protein, partial [Pseudomonas syringae group genomosp. 7]|uniref:YidC/Oxa1 family insertase periplasmic-domain containing protein n=1 Tax=Pseudomonas syringae group genomosp. 7 TaxID=251699 RepID=UPI00376F5D3F
PDTAAGTKGSASADVPSATAITAAAPLETPAEASKDLIHVNTDVLDLAIDPVGGDLVHLRLPLYPRRQERPDVPFQ